MSATAASNILQPIWQDAALDPRGLDALHLPDHEDLLASSFQVGLAAQASIGAAAAAANLVGETRNGALQTVTVERPAAERECTGWFSLDGEVPNAWEKFSGLYATRDGHVRVHANFAHHRDGALTLLGLRNEPNLDREMVAAALREWSARDFDDAAAQAGLAVAMLRSFNTWDAHPQEQTTRDDPLIRFTRIGDAPPRELPHLPAGARPLTDIRVLDLTRILAGPICGRTLAAYGADVMLVNSPALPNISAIVDTSRGKRSAHLDLTQAGDRETLEKLVRDAHMFVQGYRPGAIDGLGFAPAQLAAVRPGLVYVSLSAYGNHGPWANRRGFDSLVQTATGFNHAEAEAMGSDAPRALPVQILDYASGFLMAFGAQAALLRQQREGGSWHVDVSLLNTARWLRSLGRRAVDQSLARLALKDFAEPFACSSGVARGMPHAAQFSVTPPKWTRPSRLPGEDPAHW